jgi:electron transport complex protein RnfB
MQRDSLIDIIDSILPQTQCRQCGFSGCKPYAVAIVGREADIDQCPPGGQEGIAKLAQLLGVAAKPLNNKHGEFKPKSVAFIDESACIGCTLCIQACPVDAILGAAKYMHTVIAPECTGCELCVAPCPVDCITLKPLLPTQEGSGEDRNKRATDRARRRYEFRLSRIEREKTDRADKLLAREVAKGRAAIFADGSTGAAAPADIEPVARAKQAVIQAAIERAKAKKALGKPPLSIPSKP